MNDKPAPTFIASADILWIKKDGSEVQIGIRIGIPFKGDANIWRCPAMLDGLDARYTDIAGETSLQALCLAVGFVRKRLRSLLDTGATLVSTSDRASKMTVEWFNAMFGMAM